MTVKNNHSAYGKYGRRMTDSLVRNRLKVSLVVNVALLIAVVSIVASVN